MSPGHYEQAQGIVIKYVHAAVLYTSRYAPAGLGPSGEQITGIGISQDHGKKRLFATVS